MVPMAYYFPVAIDPADHLRGVDKYSIGRWGRLFIILLSGWTQPTTPGDYYLPPLLWDRLMVPMAYYFPVAIDPADHLRGLLSSSIGW